MQWQKNQHKKGCVWGSGTKKTEVTCERKNGGTESMPSLNMQTK